MITNGLGTDCTFWNGGFGAHRDWQSFSDAIHIFGSTARISFNSNNTHVSNFNCTPLDFAVLDYVVDNLGKAGIQVVLDDHEDGVSLNNYAWLEMWKRIASHYKNNPYVSSYQIYNEPIWDQWITSDQQKHEILGNAIDEIRKIDPQTTIVYPPMNTSAWFSQAQVNSQELPSFIVNKGNLVQDFHFWVYPFTDQGADYGVAWANNDIRLLQKFMSHGYNIPCWVGETGLGPEMGETGKAHQKTLLTFCKNSKIPFNLWLGTSEAWNIEHEILKEIGYPTNQNGDNTKPSPMHLATVCGLSTDMIEQLRAFGHATLSKDLQDLYHKVGPIMAEYLSTHENHRKMMREFLIAMLSFLK